MYELISRTVTHRTKIGERVIASADVNGNPKNAGERIQNSVVNEKDL